MVNYFIKKFNKISANKVQLFWTLQIIGWLGIAVLTYLFLTLWYSRENFLANSVHILLTSFFGLLLSLALREVFIALWDKPVIRRMALSFFAVLFIAFIFNVIRIQLFIWVVLSATQNSLENKDIDFNKVSIFFNFGVPGTEAGEQIFYWDDLAFGAKPDRSEASSVSANEICGRGEGESVCARDPATLKPMELPITFERPGVNYRLIDFEGANSKLVDDPAGGNRTVVATTRAPNAAPWAGTTMGATRGLGAPIPISAQHSEISVWVYAPDVDIPVRLKLENINNSDVNHGIETEVRTTVANRWEPLVFDFSSPAPDGDSSASDDTWNDFGGWYFTSMLIFLCWSALFHGIKYAMLLQEERDEAAIEAREAKLLGLRASELAKEAQLQMLRYQLNPHFLFNTLNAIYASVKLGRADQAKAMVAKLSKFLRYSLDSNPDKLVTLSQELDALKLYLEIEQVRFGERLRFKTDIEPSASLCLLPGLILQPLVENAIKYAVAEQENGGTIAVEAVVERDELVLTVSDDGPGVALVDGKLPSPSGIGLTNTIQRLETAYGSEHSFELGSGVPRGLRIVMRLPYQK